MNRRLPIRIGDRFGRWRVVKAGRGTQGQFVWICLCDCGRYAPVHPHNLTSGNSKSCGCLHKERVAQLGRKNRVHGLSGTTEYHCWNQMVRRCSPRAKGQERKNYFERGIRVCRRWRRFETFLSDMGTRPAWANSIDRKNNEKGYSPSNCRWSTRKEQNGNQRRVKLYSLNGETRHLADWSVISGVNYNTLRSRILSRGLPLSIALQKGVLR